MKGYSRKGKHKFASSSAYQRMIDEIIAGERQRDDTKMMHTTSATVSMMYGQVPVELTVSNGDATINPEEIKDYVDHLIGQGFTPRTYSRSDNGSKVGKKGTVVGITPKTGTKMFTVLCKLDDGAGDFEFNAFRATDYRKNDRITVVKNDRGFLEGQVIIDNGEQKSFDDIPF